jgi:uncharacterized heparinase superfamily protein
MAGFEVQVQDAALDALGTLSEVTESGIGGLTEVNKQFVTAQSRRRQGWSWQRIVSSTDLPTALATVARLTANLGRDEGVRISEIGHFSEVTRQRVSALLRPRSSD